MYLTAITDALNIKRSAFSLGDTLRYITTTVLNLFFGTLVVKFGEKKLISAGFICLISFTLINSGAEHLILFYISSILLGIGLSWTTTAMMSYVAGKWCSDKNRGTVTGAILAANGLGGAISAQILSPIIFEEGNLFGYRNAYRLVAVILAVMLLLIILFFRDKKSEDGSVPVRKTRKARGGGWVGMEFYEVKKKPYFYLALFCMVLIGMSLQGLGGITTPHLYDVGLSKPLVANITTTSSILLIFSKFFSGFMYDKMGIKITMNVSFVASFFSLLGLVLVSNTTVGIIIAFVRVVFAAIALPLETIMLPLFASELFGNKCFAKTVGLFTAASTAGFAIGAPFGNLCYDILGNYNFAFIVFACLIMLAAIIMQFVVRAARKDRKIIEARECASE